MSNNDEIVKMVDDITFEPLLKVNGRIIRAQENPQEFRKYCGLYDAKNHYDPKKPYKRK